MGFDNPADKAEADHSLSGEAALHFSGEVPNRPPVLGAAIDHGEKRIILEPSGYIDGPLRLGAGWTIVAGKGMMPKQPRRSTKGMLGLGMIMLGILIVVNDIFDQLKHRA